MTHSRNDLRSAVAAAVTIACAGVVVVTCTAAKGPDRVVLLNPSASSPSASSATAPNVTGSNASASAIAVTAASNAPVASRDKAPGLAQFRAALESVAQGKRSEPVRVLWVGDSHASSDFWTGEARRVLQKKYGDAGPGFVHLGWGLPHYRHDGLKFESIGTWDKIPNQPATSAKTDDGVLGLGGVRFVGYTSSKATAELTQSISGPLRWKLFYRNLSSGAFTARVITRESEGEKGVEKSSNKVSPDIEELELESPGGPSKLEVEVTGGMTQFFGVVIERKTTGVVLDTLGIGGARVVTALSWDSTSWSKQIDRRKPDLVVIAYGTNESQEKDGVVERYRSQMDRLLTTIEREEHKIPCVVITPMDRANQEAAERLPAIRRGFEKAAEKHGCSVWSAFDSMGGTGSISAWANERPARAAKDGVHLTAKGYNYLGERFAQWLLGN